VARARRRLIKSELLRKDGNFKLLTETKEAKIKDGLNVAGSVSTENKKNSPFSKNYACNFGLSS